MTFDDYQIIAFACIAVFFVLGPLSWVFYAETARMEASRLAKRCREAITHHLRAVDAPQAESEGRNVELHLLDEMRSTPVGFPTRRTYLLHVSHLIFVAFVAHFIVCLVVFAASGADKTRPDAAYLYATWFAVAYLASAVVYICLEGTYKWIFAFATGGHVFQGKGEDSSD